MMVSMNQVLQQPTEVSRVTSGNCETHLEGTKKADNEKEPQDFVEVKGDSGLKVQGKSANKCRESTPEVMKSKPDNTVCPAVEVKKSNPGQTAALKAEKGVMSPTLSSDSGPLSDSEDRRSRLLASQVQ